MRNPFKKTPINFIPILEKLVKEANEYYMINAKKARELSKQAEIDNEKQKEDNVYEVILQIEHKIDSAISAGRNQTRIDIPYYFQAMSIGNPAGRVYKTETVCLEKEDIVKYVLSKLEEAGYKTHFTSKGASGTYYKDELVIEW